MASNSQKNKRIAKNTLLLYIRMAFTMMVGLYTSRVILKTLGAEDFGIYNVVGGVIVMISFLTVPLAGTSSRYITYALGEGDKVHIEKVFSTIRIILLILSGIVFVFGQTVGLWFVLNKLVIPETRLTAALWVYECSVFITVVSIMSIPYNGLIIGHEQMNAFAYISVFEVLAKLLIVYLLSMMPFDHLVVYAVLLFIVQLIVRFLYVIYCRRHFEESKAKWIVDRKLGKEIFAFLGWCSFGSLAIFGYTQGLNILLNLFFGPMLNAARGIAVQVQSATTQLCSNFQMALNPQITKSYASGDYSYMHILLVNSSKFSFFLMLFVALPILVNTPFVLHLWLGKYPDYTEAFIRIMLLIALFEPLKNPLLISLQATGKIRKFQIIEGIVQLAVVPVSYVLLKCGITDPIVVYLAYLFIEIVTQIIRVKLILPRINLNMMYYLHKVMLPVFFVAVILLPPALLVDVESGWNSFVLSTLACFSVSICVIFLIGMRQEERNFVIQKLSVIRNRLLH